MRKLQLGDWTIGQVNAALAVVQVLLVLQGGSRGEDYVIPRPPGAPPLSPALSFIEASSSITTLGWVFLAGAGMVMTGLYGGWTRPIIAGHGVLFALYVAFGWGLFNTVPAVQPLPALLWGAVLGAGLFLGLTRWRARNWVRFWSAMVLTGIGGWQCGFALGYDFRSATALLVAGGGHLAIGFGLAVITEKNRDHPWLAAAGRRLRTIARRAGLHALAGAVTARLRGR
ncbi:hypothetical protein TEK04_19615 [Klenkia sp. LSe6-5]|uniref:Uncharacterized protein n=1 Tax=Klenkia sesuvii TaxID=3103137 RepID=A0ABU8DYN2_9ACTN